MSKILPIIALPVALILLVTVVMVGRLGVTGGASAGGCAPALPADLARAGLTQEKFANATTIVTVGQQMRVPQRGWVVAVAAAMQESDLINTLDGDRDSVGLFQQRPSQGWGSPAQLHDPQYASRQFYTKLLRVKNWQNLPLTVAAQAVETSNYPDAYAKHEPACHPHRGHDRHRGLPVGSDFGRRVVQFASLWIGKAGYDWTRETTTGRPTRTSTAQD